VFWDKLFGTFRSYKGGRRATARTGSGAGPAVKRAGDTKKVE
jgi:hypothetical protein